VSIEYVERPPTWLIEQKEKAVGSIWWPLIKSESDHEEELPRSGVGRIRKAIPVKVVKEPRIRRRRVSRTVLAAALIPVATLVVLVVLYLLHPALIITLYRHITNSLQFFKDLVSPYKTSLNLGRTVLKIDGGYLVVEYRGRGLPYLWLKIGDKTLHLTPYIVNSSYSVNADYIFVNSTYSKAVYPLSKILSLIKASSEHNKIELIVNTASSSCGMRLLDGDRLVFTSCNFVILRHSHSYSSSISGLILATRSLYEVLVYDVNSTTIDYLRQHLVRNLQASTRAELVWNLPKWLEDNTEYSYKSGIHLFYVYNPIEFFKVRKGVCVDYAVFTATALLAGGFNEVYILVFNTVNGQHAAAAIEFSGILYVIDQGATYLRMG